MTAPSFVRVEGGYASLDGRFELRRDGSGWSVWDTRPPRMIFGTSVDEPVRVAWRSQVEAALVVLARVGGAR